MCGIAGFVICDDSEKRVALRYYSDPRKMKKHYPAWNVTRSLETIFKEIVTSWSRKLSEKAGR